MTFSDPVEAMLSVFAWHWVAVWIVLMCVCKCECACMCVCVCVCMCVCVCVCVFYQYYVNSRLITWMVIVFYYSTVKLCTRPLRCWRKRLHRTSQSQLLLQRQSTPRSWVFLCPHPCPCLHECHQETLRCTSHSHLWRCFGNWANRFSALEHSWTHIHVVMGVFRNNCILCARGSCSTWSHTAEIKVPPMRICSYQRFSV